MKLRDLARTLGADAGDASPDAEISGIASLHDAVRGDLSFLANKKYANQVADTKASAVLVEKDFAGTAPEGCALLRVDSPDRAFGAAVPLFTPPPVVRRPGVHPTAVICEGATLGKDVFIGPLCVVGPNAKIGDRTVLEAHVVVADECEIGCDVHLYPMVSVRERCKIGDRSILHNGVVIGGDGFGYSWNLTPTGIDIKKIPQLGNVVVGHDVEIGANTTIDRARFGSTIIGDFNKIDNLVQIGHNVRTGPCCGMAAHVGVAGSTHLGTGDMLWGQVGVAGHLTIGDGVEILAQSGVSNSIAKPGRYFGVPAIPMGEYVRNAHFAKKTAKIDALEKRIAELEAALARLNGEK